MKAALALILIYVGTFLVAIQGSSSTPAQTGEPGSAKQISGAHRIDPLKEADIRALLELVGSRDQVQESVRLSAEQYREKLLASVQNSDKSQAFVNAVISNFENKFDVDQVNEQLVSIYDKHYSDEEIKGLLQFYGSPLGQKTAAEAPKIWREIQDVTHSTGAKAAREALQEARKENPGTGQNARLANPGPRRLQHPSSQAAQQPDLSQQAAQRQDQP